MERPLAVPEAQVARQEVQVPQRSIEVSSNGRTIVVYVRSWEELSDLELCQLENILQKPGMKTIVAPYLSVSPEAFRDSPLFHHGVAADGFVHLCDPGRERDGENIMFVDGHEDRKTELPLPQGRWTMDHHTGRRYEQRAACDQFCAKLAARGVEEFMDERGQMCMNIFFSRCPDEDCAMVRALAHIAEKAVQAGKTDEEIRAMFAEGTRLREIAEAEGKMDVWMGAPIGIPTPVRSCLKHILLPDALLKRDFLRMSPDDVERAFEDIDSNVEAYMRGDAHGAELQMGYGQLRAMEGWTYVTGAQPDGRTAVRQQSLHALIIFVGNMNPDGKRMYTVAYLPKDENLSDQDFPFANLYHLLNFAEELREKDPACPLRSILDQLLREYAALQNSSGRQTQGAYWGGAEGGGCIPRGSHFVDQEFIEIMNRIVTLLRGQQKTKGNVESASIPHRRRMRTVVGA